MSFRVRLTRGVEADLEHLFDFDLERELSRDGGDLALISGKHDCFVSISLPDLRAGGPNWQSRANIGRHA